MADVNVPLWKKNLEKAHTPEAQRRASESRRAKQSVKEALLNAFDKLGNQVFFENLGRGSAEDRRCLAMILAKLIPLEVAGSLDHSLTVNIVKLDGDRQIVIAGGAEANLKRPPRDAITGEWIPVADEVGSDA